MVQTRREVWSVRQVAQFLGVSVQTIYHYRAGRAPDGFPRGYRISDRAVRYDADEVRAWLEQRRDPVPAA